MRDDPVISTRGLGKRYRLGEVQAYKTLRDGMMHALRKSVTRWSRRRAGGAGGREHIWAIRDINLDIRRGEAVGIIGGNGAGKSTLLKILSRITEPTTGEGVVHGRVGSLLEVGTGFHPELTGRENIYLNGAILGMPWADIRRQFDAIVSFAEVERFVDTPIKHYSSGMYMRLAFAVAAHLEPDILMVDEVLAVGDVAFQKKCLGRMGEVAHAGRTVLFVSHNMAQMRRLCSSIVWLSEGQIAAQGPADEMIGAYLSANADVGRAVRTYEPAVAPGDDTVRLLRVAVCGADDKPQGLFNMNEAVTIRCECEVRKPIGNFHIMLDMYTQEGIMAFGTSSFDRYGLERRIDLEPGHWTFECRIPPFLLNRGAFSLSLNGQIPGVRFVFREDRVVQFEVSEIGGAGGAKSSLRAGVCRPLLGWRIRSPERVLLPPEALEIPGKEGNP